VNRESKAHRAGTVLTIYRDQMRSPLFHPPDAIAGMAVVSLADDRARE